jgi:hypothetical protein
MKSLAHPQVRQRMSDVAREHSNRPEVKQQRSEATTAAWQDPEKREHMQSAMNQPEVKQQRSEATTAAWQDPEKRTHMTDGAKHPEAKKRHREAIRAALQRPEVIRNRTQAAREVNSRPEVKERHREVAVSIWAKRKEKLAVAERILAQRRAGPEKETKARITLAACLVLEGLSKGAMKHHLYPKQNVAKAALSATKVLFNRYRLLIEREKDRLAALRVSERHAEAARARTNL